MKEIIRVLSLVALAVAIAPTSVVAQQSNYVINRNVSIPFSVALGVGVARETLSLEPGEYVIQLSVARAGWDQGADSVASAVPIGMQWLIKDINTGRDVNKSNWTTGQGEVGLRVKVFANTRCILFYSTLAPAGAAGRLTITKW